MAIEINPNFAEAYNNRGSVKEKIKDYQGAIIDFTTAIKIKPNYGYAYRNRGIVKEYSGDLNDACNDWRKAAELGIAQAAEWVQQQC